MCASKYFIAISAVTIGRILDEEFRKRKEEGWKNSITNNTTQHTTQKQNKKRLLLARLVAFRLGSSLPPQRRKADECCSHRLERKISYPRLVCRGVYPGANKNVYVE